MPHLKRFSVILWMNTLLIIIFSACNNNTSQNKKNDTVPVVSLKDKTIQGSFNSKLDVFFDSSRLTQFLEAYPKLEPYKKDLDSFYYKRKFAFAWYDKNGLIEPAANLFNRIQNISDEGLQDTFPYIHEFIYLMKNNGMDSLNKPSPFTDFMLTSQYFIYARNVWQGIDEKQSISLDWLLPRKKVSYNELLDSLVSGKDILDNAPVYIQYGRLRSFLKKYKDIQAKGGWPQIIPEKKVYKLGDSSATVTALRNHLSITEDLLENNNSSIFDSALFKGLVHYQERLGLTMDGAAGPAVFREMNIPVEKRIEQIIVNMERSRWVPVNLQSNYIIVNIPEYKLHVYENNKHVWDMNVVVGQPAHKTVIFNGEIKYVVFSPYWNVPPGIMRNEVMPGIQKNSNYLANHNMEWNGGNVRQKPGPNNSLGLVKFLFPNSFDIYLHDTPAKSLFGESSRAFSHGCIRLSDAEKMADYLLRNDTTWSKKSIYTAMHSGKVKFVTLKNPEPVFIAYFTAWVTADGILNFRNDVYKRDTRLASTILKSPQK